MKLTIEGIANEYCVIIACQSSAKRQVYLRSCVVIDRDGVHWHEFRVHDSAQPNNGTAVFQDIAAAVREFNRLTEGA